MNKFKINKLIAHRCLLFNGYSKILRNLSSKNLTPLEGYLYSKIKFNGPITVAEYMKEALGNPKWVFFLVKFFFWIKIN